MRAIEELDDKALAKEIGRRIAFLRRSSSMKQEELSEKAGLSRNALSRLENGTGGGIRLESFLSVLRSLNALNRMSAVLPEPTLTPLQLAEIEEKGAKSLPKRVRTQSRPTERVWGDGTPVA